MRSIYLETSPEHNGSSQRAACRVPNLSNPLVVTQQALGPLTPPCCDLSPWLVPRLLMSSASPQISQGAVVGATLTHSLSPHVQSIHRPRGLYLLNTLRTQPPTAPPGPQPTAPLAGHLSRLPCHLQPALGRAAMDHPEGLLNLKFTRASPSQGLPPTPRRRSKPYHSLEDPNDPRFLSHVPHPLHTSPTGLHTQPTVATGPLHLHVPLPDTLLRYRVVHPPSPFGFCPDVLSVTILSSYLKQQPPPSSFPCYFSPQHWYPALVPTGHILYSLVCYCLSPRQDVRPRGQVSLSSSPLHPQHLTQPCSTRR